MSANAIDKKTEQAVYEILGTMGEALEHLRLTEQEELRQLVNDGRRQVTGILEDALDCSLDGRISASKLSDEDWLRTAYFILGELAEPFQPRNFADREFMALLDYTWSHSEREILKTIKSNLMKVKRLSKETYQSFVNYFVRFPLWGTLDPERGDYVSSPVIKCKKTPRKKCSFMAEEAKKR